MKATIKHENGHSWLECYYDPAKLNWNEAIAAALASAGIRPGQLRVICRPSRFPASHNNNLASVG
jgi:hypothetical protein